MAEAMSWVSRITTICGMFSLPPLGGVWVDGKLGTTPLFIVIGAALGFTAGIYSLLKIVTPEEGS
jgi:F0F1-type ATP synthase assembly protein I